MRAAMSITEITGMGSPFRIPRASETAQAPAVKRTQETGRISGESAPQTPVSGGTEALPRKDADPGSISLTFNREESFDYIGSDSDTAKLDVQKAVSDMQKDSVLQEYQYFVGGKQNLQYDGDIDGSFFIRE